MMTTLWRININPDSRPGIDPRKFCIDEKILGVGWRVDHEGPVDWETYNRLAKTKYQNDNGWTKALNAIKERMKQDDLCWTRDLHGLYYLGRVVGEWMYCCDEKHSEADVVNYRNCSWEMPGLVDSVPGKVVNSFIPNSTIQAVHDDSALRYSQFLYNKLSNSRVYPSESINGLENIFSLISSEDCEDIVGLFLQEKGYKLIASSCKASTATYEFVLIDNKGNKAVAQVKQGDVDLNVEDYSGLPSKVFLFTSRGEYTGELPENVEFIKKEKLLEFVDKKRKLMPFRIEKWLNWLDHS